MKYMKLLKIFVYLIYKGIELLFSTSLLYVFQKHIQ